MHEGEKVILDDAAIADALIELPGWELKNKQIGKTYTFESFMAGIEFVNDVAKVAEAMNHHPDLHINYKKVKLFCWTHKFNGVTRADTDLAARIEEVYAGG